ncbi:hypothetical protein [Citrobacter youngae]|uniref:hypothetical protein n=1 Tax=Citrobacter youngae TaxID=133448 RepID=UPI003F1DE170
MNHIEFIEKHVREELVRQGFTAAVAQGGHFRLSICTSACLRQVAKGGFLMMFCVTRNYGQKNRRCRRIDLKLNALSAVVSKDCSEKGEDRCVPAQTVFGCKSLRNHCEVIMTKSFSKYQAREA